MSKQHRHRNTGRDARFWVSLLFSFLLSFVLVLTSMLVILRFALSEDYIVKISKDEAFYAFVVNEIENDAYDYTLPTGIDPEIVKGVFLAEDVARDMNDAIRSSFVDAQPQADVTELKARIVEKATAFYADLDDPAIDLTAGAPDGEAAENEAAAEEETAEAEAETAEAADAAEDAAAGTGADIEAVVNAYADDLAEIYVNGLKVLGLNYVATISATIAKYFPIGLVFCVVMIFLLGGMCIRLHHYVHKGVRYLAYATGGATLSLFIGPMFVKATHVYTRLNLQKQSLYYLATGYISSVLQLFFVAAAICLALTVVCIVIVAVKRNRLIHRHGDE